jgi:AcrR family transcriptional regulator
MRARSPRGSLRRNAILDCALDVVDRHGLDALTIRRLARELGRAPMSLYAHFASKRELLDLTFERLVLRLFARHHHSTWQAELEAACRHMRRELLHHPHWVTLLTRVRVPPSALDVYDQLLDLMWKDGFDPEAAMLAFSSVVSHALGSVLLERMMGGDPSVPKQRLALVKGMLADGHGGSHPRVAAVSPAFDAWSYDRVFDVGVRSIIAGIDESAPRRKGYRRRA